MMSIIAANLKLNGYEKGIGVNVLDLFSGIGGFSLGLESTGFFKTVGFCEQDKFCQKVLRKHWKDVPIYEDIKTLDARKIQADVVVGGFPCQSFSIAGKQKGKDDERYLWDEMFRVIKEAKPRWIIGENVQNLTNISDGQILQGIHNDLESQGYEVQTFNISASSQGAWHKRSRIWIVAANTNNARNRTSQHEINKGRKKIDEGRKEQPQSKSSGHIENVSNTNSRLSIRENKEIQSRGNTINNGSSADVPNTISSLRRRGGAELKGGENEIREFHSKEKEQSEQYIWSKAIGHNAVLREGENFTNSNSKGSQGHRLQSNNLQKSNQSKINTDSNFTEQQTWWQTQSSLCGIPDGIQYGLDKDRSHRIKALGNSIVPQIIKEIGLAIYETEK